MLIRVAAEAGFADWALELAGRFLGLELARVDPGAAEAEVAHGDAAPSARLRLPRVAGYGVDDVPGPDAAEPFDLFAALRFWLTDEGNADAPDAAFDSHDRLMAAASAQERRGVRELPIVNAYLARFGAWLEQHVGVRCAPRRARIVLSHDVDEPLDPSVWRRLGQVGLALRRGEPGIAYAYARSLPGEWRSRGGRHWLFSEVLAAEARHGFTSTFFFASRAARDPGASLYDVVYDARAPRFAPVYREIRERGGEVGLHVSYNAREGGADAVRREREALEAASGGPVRGSRHHYWHMARPFWSTLAAHGEAGLAWDASLAFNEAPGYRLGIAFPFRPWSPLTQAPLRAVQVPTFAMDAPLCADPETALARFDALLEPLVRYGGTASLDWHVRTSYPGSALFSAWGEVYLAILARLAGDSRVDVVPAGEALADVV